MSKLELTELSTFNASSRLDMSKTSVNRLQLMNDIDQIQGIGIPMVKRLLLSNQQKFASEIDNICDLF